MALGRRELRNALEDAGLQIDEDEIDVDRVRQSYNVAPGYYEPIYRAVEEGGAQDDAGEGPAGGAEESGEPMDETSDSPGTREDGGATTERSSGKDATSTNTSKPTATASKDGKVKYKLSHMKWGLIPSWTKRNPDYTALLKTINCRDDSLYENKGMWTSMKNTKRCIVVAQGFFEWLNKGRDKVPHFTKRSDGQLLYIAGLWDCVRYEDSQEDLYTYTIITTSSSKQLNFLHDRMPVIFEPNSPEIKTWLDPSRRWDEGLQRLLQPFEKSGLEFYPVKKEVGKVGNNSPSFIVPLDSAENKSNIKNFFNKGTNVKPLQPFKEPEKPWTNPKKLGDIEDEEESKVKTEDEEESKVKLEDDESEVTTTDSPSVEALNPEDNAPLPVLPSPSKSPTKSNPSTPLHPAPKRKLEDITSDDSPMVDSSPTKTPSPVKKEQKSYSSTSFASNPKKGVGTASKRAKKGSAAAQGNKSITSFFSKE